jgi:hypothetical protein
LPPLEQQTAFNLQRWFELQNDPDLAFANSIDFFVCGMSSLVGLLFNANEKARDCRFRGCEREN